MKTIENALPSVFVGKKVAYLNKVMRIDRVFSHPSLPFTGIYLQSGLSEICLNYSSEFLPKVKSGEIKVQKESNSATAQD